MDMTQIQRSWLMAPLAAAAMLGGAGALAGGAWNGDDDEWRRLEIDDPNDVRMLDVFVRGRLRKQGLTEVFFESAEPRFDELAPARFFKRFPEGIYDFSAITLDGEELDSEVRLSHVMAAPPGNVRVSGLPSAVNCDAEPLPSVSGPVTISWNPV